MRGAALHRMNPVGELPAIWRCHKCLKPDNLLTIDPDVLKITKAITDSNQK